MSVTVTSAYEAGVADRRRARTTWWSRARTPAGTAARSRRTWNPAPSRCTELLDRIGSAHRGIPLIAAGGLGTAEDVVEVLRRGAVAAQIGTALLLSDEAGTNAAHRAAH